MKNEWVETYKRRKWTESYLKSWIGKTLGLLEFTGDFLKGLLMEPTHKADSCSVYIRCYLSNKVPNDLYMAYGYEEYTTVRFAVKLDSQDKKVLEVQEM